MSAPSAERISRTLREAGFPRDGADGYLRAARCSGYAARRSTMGAAVVVRWNDRDGAGDTDARLQSMAAHLAGRGYSVRVAGVVLRVEGGGA